MSKLTKYLFPISQDIVCIFTKTLSLRILLAFWSRMKVTWFVLNLKPIINIHKK